MNEILDRVHEMGARKFYRSQFREMILMDKAHGMMLVKQKLLDKDIYKVIANGLDQVLLTVKEEDITGDKEDLYFCLTSKLYDVVGEEIGCQVHVGRSRNDMECACNRMEIRKSIWEICEVLLDLMEVLLKQAKENLDTVLTYYTFGQPAQPGTLAHYEMLLFTLLSRDLKRLQAAYANTNRSPMGAAAGIGTGFVLDRQYICDLLGFDSVIENSMDAISSPDYILETEAAIAIMMTTISKAAQDMFFWATDECHILDCDVSISGRSSIMPQKKNPVAIENARSKSGHITGLFSEALALNRNTTLFPNMEASVELHYMYWEYLEETMNAMELMRTALENSSIRKQKSYERTCNNFTGAATMAESLAMRYHLPFTQTHHIVNGMIRKLMEEDSMDTGKMTGKLMEEISAQVLGTPLVMTDEEVRTMLDPLFCLESKVTGGTPKPSDTRKLLEDNREIFHAQKEWLEAAKRKVDAAYESIEKGV